MRAHTRITLLHVHVHVHVHVLVHVCMCMSTGGDGVKHVHTCIYMHVHGVSSAGLFEVVRVDEVQQRLQRERRHVSHLPSISRSYRQSEHKDAATVL